MFDKLQKGKDLMKMRSEAKKLQKELEQIEHVEENGGMRVKVNGAQHVVYLEVDGEEQSDVTELINKAFKNVQKKAAKKMMEMGGGLGGLFGN